MANYYGCTRTNYFAVTDPDKLKDIVDRIVWNEGRLGFKSGGPGFYDLSEREMMDRTVGLNEYLIDQINKEKE